MQCLVVCCFVLVCPLQHQHLRASACQSISVRQCMFVWGCGWRLLVCGSASPAAWCHAVAHHRLRDLEQPLSDVLWICADCWRKSGRTVSSSCRARCRHVLRRGGHAHQPGVQGGKEVGSHSCYCCCCCRRLRRLHSMLAGGCRRQRTAQTNAVPDERF